MWFVVNKKKRNYDHEIHEIHERKDKDKEKNQRNQLSKRTALGIYKKEYKKFLFKKVFFRVICVVRG